jgi:hypothetical protein
MIVVEMDIAKTEHVFVILIMVDLIVHLPFVLETVMVMEFA